MAMNNKVLYCLFEAVALATLVISTANYGVGFSLSLDYGYLHSLWHTVDADEADEADNVLISVASIYFLHGSTINVAKIEGSSTYRRVISALHTFEELTASLPFKIDNGLELQAEAAQVLISRPPFIYSVLQG